MPDCGDWQLKCIKFAVVWAIVRVNHWKRAKKKIPGCLESRLCARHCCDNTVMLILMKIFELTFKIFDYRTCENKLMVKKNGSMQQLMPVEGGYLVPFLAGVFL